MSHHTPSRLHGQSHHPSAHHAAHSLAFRMPSPPPPLPLPNPASNPPCVPATAKPPLRPLSPAAASLTGPTISSPLSPAALLTPGPGASAGDLDIFHSLAEIKPGSIPLLVRMPDGNCEQVDVPCNSTVDDLCATLQKSTTTTAAATTAADDDLRLSFGNTDLPPGATLLDSNIVSAYEHAGSLLRLIGQGGLDAESKAAALDSACAVVESVSNGITDMEALCAAAMDPAPVPTSPAAAPASPRVAAMVAAGAAEAARDTPKEIDGGEFKMLNSMLSRPVDRDPAPGNNINNNNNNNNNPRAATPSELARGLSRRMPLLFPPAGPAAQDAVAPLEQGTSAPLPETEPMYDEQPALAKRQSSLAIQPSISNIREARRRARKQLSNADAEPSRQAQTVAANAVTIGGSTNGMPVRPPSSRDAATVNAAAAASSQRDSTALMASAAKSTWLEDLMKTWEVGVVRDSGVLEKSKDGQELNEYFEELEEEAQREVETARIESTSADPVASRAGDSSGDSEDSQGEGHEKGAGGGEDEEEGEKGEQNGGGNTKLPSPLAVKTHPHAAPGFHPSILEPSRGKASARPNVENGADSLRNSMAKFGLSESGKDPAVAMMRAHAVANDSLIDLDEGGCKPPELSPRHPLPRPLPSAQQYSHSPKAHSVGHAPSCGGSRGSSPSSSSGLNSKSADLSRGGVATGVKMRQATKIAPAPNVTDTPSPGADGAALANSMFPPPLIPSASWPPHCVPGPKKRGRKRKNPELTEDERALVRKEQNKESAKLSRVRRKVIAAEYEGRLNSLIGENTMLRKQVEGLNNRLVYLQSLLTISVRQEGP